MSNPWLTPYQRSYEDIKNKLVSQLKLNIPEITDYSEGNIFIILISLYAAIAEVIHYYIDNTARELFFSSCRKYDSLVKHSRLVDYHIKCAIASSVDVIISRSDGTPIDADISIPANTVFTSSDGKQWLSTKLVVWSKNTYNVLVPVVQQQQVTSTTFGTITSSNTEIALTDLESGLYYVEGSMVLTIDSIQWTLVDTFAYSGPLDKHFIVDLGEDLIPTIKFGDGKNGSLPPLGKTAVGSYYLTYGSSGNIDPDSLVTVPDSITQVVSNAVCTNSNSASGGTDYEDFDSIKLHVPLSLKTLGVAITKEDYENVAKLVPGVDKAYVYYKCGRYLIIYITPNGGGVASTYLLDTVNTLLLKKKVITTHIKVQSTHPVEINLYATITGQKSFKTSEITNQINEALLEAYNYNNSDIAKPIRLSDLYSLIDQLSMVDYLSITNLFLKPYPELINGDAVMTIPYFLITTLESKKVIQIMFSASPTNFYVLDENGVSLTAGVVGTPFSIIQSGVNVSMTIGQPSSGTYSVGSLFKITMIPNNVDQEPNGYVIPVFLSTDSIKLSVNETV